VLADAAISPVAFLLADPARVSILLALSDGREVAAGELALVAGVTAATAGFHLAKLTSAGLIGLRRQGRHQLYRLASPEVVQALEALAVLAPQGRLARIARRASVAPSVPGAPATIISRAAWAFVSPALSSTAARSVWTARSST
jgi:DNA-binding transcriptional ArsR family regulator